MSFVARLRLAVLLLLVSDTLSLAQDAQQLGWPSVPSNEAGLVLVLNADVSWVSITDDNGKVLDVAKWGLGLPFVRQYRLEPGVYQIQLGGIISSVGVVTKSGALTYLRLSALPGMSSETNITASTGRVPADIVDLAKNAQKMGFPDVFKVSFLKSENQNLVAQYGPAVACTAAAKEIGKNESD